MLLPRMLAAAFLSLAATSIAQAADDARFSVLVNNSAGKPIMFESTVALKKGDVIKIHAFNAPPRMVLQIAMCNSDCPRMHLVKTVSLMPYFMGLTNTNQSFVVPEDGHVSFWVQKADNKFITPIGSFGGTLWSIDFNDPILLSYTEPQLYHTPPMPANALQVYDDTLQARFYHRTFVTVSLADVGS
jgi:hypothetical protein